MPGGESGEEPRQQNEVAGCGESDLKLKEGMSSKVSEGMLCILMCLIIQAFEFLFAPCLFHIQLNV